MGNMTLPNLLKQSKGQIYLRYQDKLSYEDILFKAQMLPVVSGFMFAAAPFCQKYSELRQIELIVVGKQQDDNILFPPVTPSQADQDFLTQLLQQDGDDIRFSRFEPNNLPLLIVQDSEVKLKQRIEQDQADKRIGAAALMLAKLHTDKIDDQVKRRVYINIDCPLIEQLLSFKTDLNKATQLATLMRSFMSIMSHDNSDLTLDFTAQLQSFTTALQQLIRE